MPPKLLFLPCPAALICFSIPPLADEAEFLSSGDDETFSEKIPLCSTDNNPVIIEFDVTGMIEADYQRSPEPVAAFRMELGDHEQFDVTDDLQNSYNFWGPDALAAPEKSPTLMLSFE